MIRRNHYLDLLIKNKNNGFPKVITGIRRCGKSYLLKEIYAGYLLDNGISEDQILILELDDDRNLKYRNPLELGKYVREFCAGKADCYIFLDEIQLVNTIINPIYTDGKYIIAKESDENVVTFVDVILGLSREKNIDLYVTGSNSKMLSSDIITEFRDKAVDIHIGPLSFDEYYQYTGGSKTEAIYEFMQYGGMPLAVLKSPEEKQTYLKNLFQMTYFRDIIDHNRIRKTDALDEICDILSTCTGELINTEKIANTYQSRKHEKIDKNTVERYIDFFIDAFIIRKAKRYDVKGKQEIGALRKYYFADPGLRNARLNFALPDEGQIIENIVYNELIYNGYNVNIGTYEKIEKKSDGKNIRKTLEIDFFAVKNQRMYYIQVSADISDTKTKIREQKPYLSLHDQIRKIIVINKPVAETRDELGFTVIGLADFLLRFIK
jgi:hypothetical protein